MNNEKISTSILYFYSFINCVGSSYRYSKDLSHIANPNQVFGLKPGDPLYPSKDLTLLAFDHYITLISVDDETEFPPGFIFMVLKPGNHTVQVSLRSPNFRSNSSVKIKFVAKPNQTVFICREQTRTSWNPQAKSLDGFLPETQSSSPCNNEF